MLTYSTAYLRTTILPGNVLGMVGGCCDHLSGMLRTQLGRLCLLAVLTHPPTSLYAALTTLQVVFKTSLKTSQSNIYVNAIALLYF